MATVESKGATAKIVDLWRYPFKSMLGEQLRQLTLTERGAYNDRLFALRERATHKLVTARQQPELLSYQAKVAAQGIEVTYPDGKTVLADDPELIEMFSAAFGRKLVLEKAFEGNVYGLFDDSSILLISMQSLKTLAAQHQESVFDKRRFRANIWIDIDTSIDGKGDFPEEKWLGKTLLLGDQVRLSVDRFCERCVMTTLPQYDLEKDFSVLKTITQVNNAVLGIYCSITHGGTVRVGDSLRVIE